MDYVSKFENLSCTEGRLIIMWMGQAGFLMKNSRNKVLALDVYLSDLSMRLDGNKRLMPALMTGKELKADMILASHNHTDHLDVDSLPDMMNGNARLYCSEGCVPLCEKASLPMERVHAMKTGDIVEQDGYRVKAVFADHGDAAPDALGFVIESEGIRIYFTGDTGLQLDRMAEAMKNIDILIAPINGQYGNMNECDAAMLAEAAKPKLTIPCHFWTFSRHQGNPYEFETAMKMMAPEQESYLMAQGEAIYVTQNGKV